MTSRISDCHWITGGVGGVSTTRTSVTAAWTRSSIGGARPVGRRRPGAGGRLGVHVSDVGDGASMVVVGSSIKKACATRAAEVGRAEREKRERSLVGAPLIGSMAAPMNVAEGKSTVASAVTWKRSLIGWPSLRPARHADAADWSTVAESSFQEQKKNKHTLQGSNGLSLFFVSTVREWTVVSGYSLKGSFEWRGGGWVGKGLT